MLGDDLLVAPVAEEGAEDLAGLPAGGELGRCLDGQNQSLGPRLDAEQPPSTRFPSSSVTWPGRGCVTSSTPRGQADHAAQHTDEELFDSQSVAILSPINAMASICEKAGSGNHLIRTFTAPPARFELAPLPPEGVSGVSWGGGSTQLARNSGLFGHVSMVLDHGKLQQLVPFRCHEAWAECLAQDRAAAGLTHA